jgi:RNA polymerase sigma factor (TIGR02999 family)
MVDKSTQTITRILRAWSDGDSSAEEQLWPLVYDELHRMATRCLNKERSDHTLQATALLHESYLKLVDQRQARFQDRNHFFAIAAKIMRRILVDHERSRRCAKRGGGRHKVPLDGLAETIPGPASCLVAIDDALNSLERIDPLKVSIVELRFFAGMSYKEAGEVLGCSDKTVQRHWGMARTWLYRELKEVT